MNKNEQVAALLLRLQAAKNQVVWMSRKDCYNDMQQHDMAKADEEMAQKIHDQRYSESLTRRK